MKKILTLAAVLVTALAMNAADPVMWNVADWDLSSVTKVGDSITSTITVNGLQVLATDARNSKGKLAEYVMIDGNSKTWKSADESETISFSKRVKTGGKSTATGRQFVVPVTKGATIEVWACAGGDGERPVVIGDAQWDGSADGLSSFTPEKSTLGYHSYVYNGESDKLYIWGSENGINIYGIRVTPAAATNIDNTAVEGKVVKTFENGQLVVIKNGVKYNATGSVIR